MQDYSAFKSWEIHPLYVIFNVNLRLFVTITLLINKKALTNYLFSKGLVLPGGQAKKRTALSFRFKSAICNINKEVRITIFQKLQLKMGG